MSLGRTTHEDCAAILLDYFPSELDIIHLNSFVSICCEWLLRGGASDSLPITAQNVLSRMIHVAQTIASKSQTWSSHFSTVDGELWVHQLWYYDSYLIYCDTAQYGKLIHALVTCYHHHALAGDQANIRGDLHRGLENAHEDLATCEVADCQWLSHTNCSSDEARHANCLLLPAKKHRDDAADSPPPLDDDTHRATGSSSRFQPATPFSRALHHGRAVFWPLLRGILPEAPTDEEQGAVEMAAVSLEATQGVELSYDGALSAQPPILSANTMGDQRGFPGDVANMTYFTEGDNCHGPPTASVAGEEAERSLVAAHSLLDDGYRDPSDVVGSESVGQYPGLLMAVDAHIEGAPGPSMRSLGPAEETTVLEDNCEAEEWPDDIILFA